MKIEAIIRPMKVLTGISIQVWMKTPQQPPTIVIKLAVIRLIKRVDDSGEILRVIISRVVMNKTAATAKSE